MLTWKEAREELNELAKGEYHSMEYQLTDTGEGRSTEVETKCSVYITGYEWHSGDSWEIALERLERAFTAKRKKNEKINLTPEQAPIEVGK